MSNYSKKLRKKDFFEIASVFLADLSKDLTINNMKKTGLKGFLIFFSC